MEKTIEATAAPLNQELVDFEDRNCFYDGLEDGDSWVDSTSECENIELMNFDDMVNYDHHLLSPASISDPKDQTGYCHNIDFTLHTIVEESCEDSELECCDIKFNENANQRNASPTDMERYFLYGFDDQDVNNYLEDSSSEIFSDLSDSAEPTSAKNDDGEPSFNLPTSRLENYFLSEFMGFSAEIKSDSSVGSDSEGQPSPSQRKKKLRTRRTPRSNHSSFDNLLVETVEQGEQSNESLGSSESDTDKFQSEVITCDKLDSINSVKRKKNYRKREVFEPTVSLSSLECAKGSISLLPASISKQQNKSIDALDTKQVLETDTQRQFTTSLGRSDSFNNWSSDEETNVMMSKMRQFFTTLIAAKTSNVNSNNHCFPIDQNVVLVKTEPIQLPYFENELIRLMKTVPGINNQQLREIVEYFSSEDAWSDSNDSTELNGTNIDVASEKGNSRQDSAECSSKLAKFKSIELKHNDSKNCFLGPETTLMYSNLFESFMVKSSKINSKTLLIDNNKYDDYQICKNAKTEQLLVNIWQHIGQKLVELMRQDSISTDCVLSRNAKSITERLNSNEEEAPNNFLLNNEDLSLVQNNQQPACLPRSKSHDVLMGTTNRTWHSYSNSAVNDNTGETSDYDRFSWRGSFESALLAPGDSRNKLLTSGRENSSRISQWSLLKRGSVDNLWCTYAQNRKNLDRVQSCGSILGNDDTKCLKVQKMWLSTNIKNKSNEETSFAKTIQDNLSTNSLPRLQSIHAIANISNNSEFDPNVAQSNVKSARYRSSAMQSNINSIPISTKRNKSKIQHASLNKNLTSSSSLGDFSLSALNSNVYSSPTLQKKTTNKRKQNNFRGRSESLTSICSNYRYANSNVKGQIEFGMQYNYKINALEIHIVQCKDLRSVSSKRCKSDPYVKVYLLPDLSKLEKRKTRVKKQTLNPVFDETLRFHMPIAKLKKRSIWLSVWNSDLLGRNDFLGEVILELEDKVFDKPQSQWYTLQERKDIVEADSKHHGDLVVALKFIPSPFPKGKLHVLVKEAKNIFSNRTNGNCDTFCKSYLLPNRTKSGKQKTNVIKKSSNPMWNFTFVYEDLTVNELSSRALELTVWDHDRLISNQFIGGVRFPSGTGTHNGKEDSGMRSNDKETFLWREMMNRPNFWVEGTVKLRSNFKDNQKDISES